MKLLATIFLTLIFGFSTGQSFTYPTIKLSANSENDFAPSGWTVLKSATGDLNNDKLDDIALVVQHNDSVTIIKQEDDYNDTVVCQPRILIVAFYNPTTKQYDKMEQSNTFILCHDDPIMDEPFQDISIFNQVVKIDFHIWYSMGSWGMSNSSYKFRFQDNEFKLIGANSNSANRGSGETEYRSYNFVTKKVKVEIGNFSSYKKRISWRAFEFKELKTFKTFEEPFTYEVETDYYL